MGTKCKLAKLAAERIVEHRAAVVWEVCKLLSEEDVDAVHDTRVASRRVRAALREHKGVFKKSSRKAFNRDMRRVTSGLGTARELDVSIALLEKHRDESSGPQRAAANYALRKLRSKRRAESDSVKQSAEELAGEQVHELKEQLLKGAGPGRECYIKAAKSALADTFGKVVKQYHRWQDDRTDKALHKLRIRFKKHRYQCEVYAPLYCEGFDMYIDRLHDAQDLLGDWNDLRVLRDYIAELEDETPEKTREGLRRLLQSTDARTAEALARFREDKSGFFSDENIDVTLKLLGKLKVDCCGQKKVKTSVAKRYP